ncbi:MAG: hypothetical protein M1829_000339 [Trizodia sp. TS-e1964]|nr:MAG: hypothetical protein M1829_000339 [Trizodia sp. TS-e1964]
MKFSFCHAAPIALWLFSSTTVLVNSLALPDASEPSTSSDISQRHESSIGIASQPVLARRNDGYYPPYLHRTTMAEVAKEMERLHGRGLKYQFLVKNIVSPEAPQTDSTPSGTRPGLRRVFKVLCWGPKDPLYWPPIPGSGNADIWLTIVAQLNKGTGLWGTYTGYMIDPQLKWLDRYIDVNTVTIGYTSDPVGVEDLILKTEVVPFEAISTTTKVWADKAVKAVENSGLI